MMRLTRKARPYNGSFINYLSNLDRISPPYLLEPADPMDYLDDVFYVEENLPRAKARVFAPLRPHKPRQAAPVESAAPVKPAIAPRKHLNEGIVVHESDELRIRGPYALEFLYYRPPSRVRDISRMLVDTGIANPFDIVFTHYFIKSGDAYIEWDTAFYTAENGKLARMI